MARDIADDTTDDEGEDIEDGKGDSDDDDNDQTVQEIERKELADGSNFVVPDDHVDVDPINQQLAATDLETPPLAQPNPMTGTLLIVGVRLISDEDKTFGLRVWILCALLLYLVILNLP